MARVSHELRSAADGQGHRFLVFMCPGCQEPHEVCVQGPGPLWTWNGSVDTPTFTPSIKVMSGHYAGAEPDNGCWCKYNAEHPDQPVAFTCNLCHSFVTDGRIQFLGDCTHALAGQTVDLPDWE